MVDINFDDAYRQKLIESYEVLHAAYRNLDPTSGSYYEDVESVSKLAKEVNEDYKNYMNAKHEEKHLTLEEIKNQDDKDTNTVRNVIAALSIGVNIAIGIMNFTTFMIGERNCNRRIDRITRKEEDEAILTLGDRTIVQDSIKNNGNRNRGFLPFFNK